MIRKSTKNDIEDIMQIWLSGNLEAHGFVTPAYWTSHYEEVKEAISQGVIVYEKEKRICGFIGVIDSYIAGLFVRQEERGQGIGTALIEDAKRQCDTLCLHVFQENESAVEFYERNGFIKKDQHVNQELHAMEYTMEWVKLTMV